MQFLIFFLNLFSAQNYDTCEPSMHSITERIIGDSHSSVHYVL